MYYVKKRLVGVFYNRGERDKDNEISLKEGKVTKIETTVLHSRAAPFAFVFTYRQFYHLHLLCCLLLNHYDHHGS